VQRSISMAHEFRPYWLLLLLFLIGASAGYLALLQGSDLDCCNLPDFQWGSDGSVVRYAGLVVSRSVRDPYTVSMLYGFFVLLVYALVQLLALAGDRRCSDRRAGGHLCRDLPGWVAYLLAPVLARPKGRFDSISSWGAREWTDYLHQAPEALLAPLGLAVQIFPLLGFLGTIAGIASALKYLPTPDNPSASISSLTASLYTAFDTTFVGLVASMTLMLISFTMERSWTRMALADR
jgi:hypothetical protein